MRICAVLFVSLLLGACASKDMRPELARGMGAIPSMQFADAKTVEQIRQLRPQARFPIKIAVILSDRRIVSKSERAVIDQLGEKLMQTGFARSVQLAPSSLVPSCRYQSASDCFLTEARKAGARLGADAILFLNDSAATDAYVNPLSILDLTIVGMWFVPGHHRDAYAVCEAALFDIDNGYLYAVAEGQGEHKSMRPYMYTEYDTGRDEARAMALNDAANRLYALSQEQMAKISAPGK